MKKNIKDLTRFQQPEESPGFLLWHLSTKWRSAIEEVLKKHLLTHPQFVVLATLGWLTKDGSIVSQIDIGRAAGLDANTVSQILRSLESKKLLQRIRSLDERSKNPVLTAEGLQKIALALPAVEQADSDFFSRLTEKEIDESIRIFQKLLFITTKIEGS